MLAVTRIKFFYQWSVERVRAGVDIYNYIRDYFQIKDGLPDPKGSLSIRLPPKAIARFSSTSILAVLLYNYSFAILQFIT